LKQVMEQFWVRLRDRLIWNAFIDA
jgi:hypothetical protein